MLFVNLKPFMTDVPKLTLSAEELQLLTNTQWILTKRVIIDKVNFLFGDLSGVFKNHVIANDFFLQPAIIQSTPKIAKGENYLQLPYVLLDYPRCFDKENIFTIRTMFWWGNFFSVTLLLSGSYKKTFETALQKNIIALAQHDFYICVNEDEWQHHFHTDNYMPVNKFTQDEINSISQRHFIKVAIKFPLEKWDEMPLLLEKSFLNLLQLIRN
jgi:hypothetical protein